MLNLFQILKGLHNEPNEHALVIFFKSMEVI